VAGVKTTASAADVASGLARHLERSTPHSKLLGTSDERPFQRWVADRSQEWLDKTYPHRYSTKCEASGGGIIPIRAFGAGSWPDVAIGSQASPTVLAVEVKCLKKRGLPNRFAQALGQALMYRQVYEGALVVYAVIEDVPVKVPNELLNTLAHNGIVVTVVKAWKPMKGGHA